MELLDKVELKKNSGTLNAQITLSGSKSISNRLLLIKTLSNNPNPITNLGNAKDVETFQKIVQGDTELWDVGPAGTAMRFATAYAALKAKNVTITGSKRMQERPIGVLVDALKDLGAKISYAKNEGFPPIQIHPAPLLGDAVRVDGNVSSQYITALLLIAPYLENGLELSLEGKVTSRPYITMTIELMKYYGAQVVWENEIIKVEKGAYQTNAMHVEADWSSASYWFSIVALSKRGTVTLKGLQENSLQADAKSMEIYRLLGVKSEFVGSDLVLQQDENNLEDDLNYNFSDCPDIAQTVVCTMVGLGVSGRLTGLHSLRIKETDRVQATVNELRKLGAQIEIEGDDWIVKRTSQLKGTELETYDDHRMAMAFAPLASVVEGLVIKDPKVVEKSYPNYWEDFQKVGFLVS